MDMYVQVEVYDGHRDGYPRSARPSDVSQPRNDYILNCNEAAPGEWDRRNQGFFCVVCDTDAEIEELRDDCTQEASHGHHSDRIVWSRTPFTRAEFDAILLPVADRDPLPDIPRMTYAEWVAAMLPINSVACQAGSESMENLHAKGKADAEKILATETARLGTVPLADRKFVELLIADAQELVASHAEKVIYHRAKGEKYFARRSKEEPLILRRAEIIAPPSKEPRSG